MTRKAPRRDFEFAVAPCTEERFIKAAGQALVALRSLQGLRPDASPVARCVRLRPVFPR